jgi:hypothetical protein
MKTKTTRTTTRNRPDARRAPHGGFAPPRSFIASVVLAAPLAFASCAGTPPAPAAAPSSPASRSSWLCAASPERVSLATLGVPAASVPIDASIENGTVTVLFQPARLVSFSQSPLERRVTMEVGDPADTWRAIDRDPVDGSLWVASEETVSLLRIGADGRRSSVKGPTVSGRGGYSGIRLDAQSVYATPTGAEDSVWRLSRDGRLLGRSFPRAPEDENRRLESYGPRPHGEIALARDPQGRVVALESETGRLFRADSDGNWLPTGQRFPMASPASGRTVQGESVGTAKEVWYVGGSLFDLFFIGLSPAALGPDATGTHSRGALVYRLTSDATAVSALEPCVQGGVRKVVSDGTTFVVLAGGFAESSNMRQTNHPPEILVGRFGAP